RYPIPAAQRLTQAPGMAAIGRYTEFHSSETGALLGHGPSVDGIARWESAKATMGSLLPPLADFNNAALRSQYRVIRAVAQVECTGYFDGVNAYDAGRVSIG